MLLNVTCPCCGQIPYVNTNHGRTLLVHCNMGSWDMGKTWFNEEGDIDLNKYWDWN
jgi:hypothetical protein